MMNTKSNNPFNRQAGGPSPRSSKPFNPKAMDHLVTVVSVDLNESDPEKSMIRGVNHLGKNALYFINQDCIARNGGFKKADKGQIEFYGFQIDADMKKALKPGRKIVIEQAKWSAKEKKGEITSDVYGANWVFGTSTQNPKKLFTGLFTASGSMKTGRINTVQHWAEKSFNASDEAALASFKAELDERAAAKKADKFTSGLGYQLRALRPTVAFDGTANYLCFDSTQPTDSIVSMGEDETRSYLPVSGDSLAETIAQYGEYLAISYPDIKDGLIDVCRFETYVASGKSKYMALSKSDKAPKNRMVNRLSLISIGDERGYRGRNVGVHGILDLTKDVLDEATGDVKKQNIVQKFHCNNSMFDVRSMIIAADDKKVSIDTRIGAVVFPKDDAPDVADMNVAIASTSQATLAKIAKDANDWEEAYGSDPFADKTV